MQKNIEENKKEAKIGAFSSLFLIFSLLWGPLISYPRSSLFLADYLKATLAASDLADNGSDLRFAG